MAKIKIQKVTFGADLSGFQQYFVVNETYASQVSNNALAYGKLIRIEGATAVIQLLSTASFINGSIATSTGASGLVRAKNGNTLDVELFDTNVVFKKEASIIDGNQPYTPQTVEALNGTIQKITFGDVSKINVGSIIHQGSIAKFGSKSVSATTEEDDGTTPPTTNKKVKIIKFASNGGTGTMNDVEVELNSVQVDYTVPPSTFVAPNGKQFKTWLGQNNIEYAPGSIIKFGNEDVFTFTAQWEDAPVVTPPAQATISVSPDTVDFSKDKVQKLLITTTEIDAQALNLKVVGSEDVVTSEFNTFSGKACSLTLTLKDNVPDNINSKFVVKSGGDSVVSNEVTITRTLDHNDTTPPQTTTKKYYVVAVAGQSNSVGYDESTWDDSFRDTTGRIKQLGYYNDDNLKVIECMPCAQNIQNMSDLPDANYAPGGYGVTKKGTKGLHLPLGQELLKVIPEGYDVLIIPVAYGMTGFTTRGGQQYDVNLKKLLGSGVNANWNKDQALYKTLEARILHALDMNADNKFLGVIWCQGEVDTDRNLEILKTGFQGIVDALSTALADRTNQLVGGKADKSLWYVHETTLFWRQYQGNQKCSEIWKWYKEFLGEKNYIRIPPDIDRTNQTNGGDKRTSSAWSSHFGNNAYRDIIAPRVVKQISDTTQLVVPEVKKDPATLDVQIQKFNLDTIVSEVPVTIQSTSPISVEISDLDIVSYDTTSKKFVIGTKNGSAIVTVKTVDDNKLNVASTFVIHVSGLTELQDAPMYRVTGKEVGKTLVTVKASKEGSTPVETIMLVRVIEPREVLTINFDLNGGSSIENLAPVTIKRGDLFKLPEADIIPPADKESFVYFELITSKHERILIMKSSEISTARFDSVNTLKAIYK